MTIHGSDKFKEPEMVANNGYQSFISLCINDKEARDYFNLGKDDGIESAHLGTPYQLGIINSQTITDPKPGFNIANYYSSINTFLFPVLFNGEIKFMISVEKYSGGDSYKIGSLGFKILSNEITKVLKKWPQKKGYSLLLLQNPESHYYSFHIPEISNSNLTILDHESEQKRIDYSSLNTISQTMKEYSVFLNTIRANGGN